MFFPHVKMSVNAHKHFRESRIKDILNRNEQVYFIHQYETKRRRRIIVSLLWRIFPPKLKYRRIMNEPHGGYFGFIHRSSLTQAAILDM